MRVSPTTVAELSEAVRTSTNASVVGIGSKAMWMLPRDQPIEEIATGALTGIIDYSPNDQVVNVRAGTLLVDLQEELAAHGQCLPMVEWNDGWSHLHLVGTVGGNLSLNLPHTLEAECGSWRDWILGMTLVQADGTVAKSGSHAVKNVAGYDIHKLMIGARGSLAVIAEVILRTYPLKSLPAPNVRFTYPSGSVEGPCHWIQRVKPTDFAQASAIAGSFAGIDIPATSTLRRSLLPDVELSRFEGDWVMRSNSGAKNLEITDPAMLHYMKRAKGILDPTNKLNPGTMGAI